MKYPHKTTRRIFLVCVLALALFLVSQTASAQTKTFSWLAWDVDITLQENGDLRIQENQTLDFQGAPFTFGFRTIPTGNLGNNDGITDVSVREGSLIYQQNGSERPGTFAVVEEGEETTIRWYFEPALGRHTYQFDYLAEKAVIVADPEGEFGDQIFWTVIPSDHPARVDSGQMVVRLPEGVRPQQLTGTTDYLVEAYIDGEETQDVDIQVSDNGRTITFTLLRPLLVGEELAVRVQFPHGILPIEMGQWQQRQQINDVLGLGLLVVSLLLAVGGPLAVLGLWYLRGRDPELSVPVPEYISEPPDDLPPAVVGTLVDERADMEDVVSTLIDLAHRGYLTMEEEEGAAGHVFQRTSKSPHDLRPFERQFLKDVFRGKQERTLDSLRYKFANKLPNLRAMLYDELVAEGLVKASPQSVRTGYGFLAGTILVVAVVSFFALPALFGGGVATAVCPSLALVLTALAMFFASRHMPVKTAKGTETAAKWSAFKNFLRNAEQYKNLEESTEIFENYLAYAVAFKLERSWIRKFSTVPNTPIPPWYLPYPAYGGHFGGVGAPSVGSPGGGDFKPPTLEGMSRGMTGGLAAMSAGLTRMLNSTSTVLKSTPPSSSGGGSFSGGGFSGGFGGGFSGGGGSAGFG